MGLFSWLFRPRPPKPPVVPPAPQPVTTRVSVWTPDGVLTTDGTATLTLDQDGVSYVATPAPEDPRWLFTLPTTTTQGWGAWLKVTGVTDCQDAETRVVLGPDLPDVSLKPDAPAIQPLRVSGRKLVTPDGRVFVWRGATAFRLLERIAAGHVGEAENYCAWAAANGVNVVRVLAMCRHMFVLAPETGSSYLPVLLDLAARHGLYVEVVCLADTGTYSFDHGAHVAAIGDICGRYPNALVEIANEPDHSTQDSRVKDPAYLESLASRIPSEVVVALGAAHGPDDESLIYSGGDYVTVHGDRADGDNGWRWVRHTREQLTVSENAIGGPAPTVNDEPMRADMDPATDKHLALAVLCRLFGLGDTFHYNAGRYAQVPSGVELAAFDARRRGWDLIPADWWGSYLNAGHAGSPVVKFDGAVRAYSSVQGAVGYTLVFGGGDPRIEWGNGWTPSLIARDGQTFVYRVTR